jgi:hypothetical protein
MSKVEATTLKPTLKKARESRREEKLFCMFTSRRKTTVQIDF